jgi:hypothetical protein
MVVPRSRVAIALALSLATETHAASAADRAQQARDYFLEPPRDGTWLMTDAYTAGVQASIEHRRHLDPEVSMLLLRASALASLGFAEAAGHVDVRYLFFTFGASGGFRNVWRTYAFPEGVSGTRELRRELDADSAFETRRWGWGEARARLAVPFERFTFVANHAIRYEAAPDNSFDWFHTTMHDGGFLLRFDATLFFRSRTFGGVGPTIRFLDLPRAGRRSGEWAFGFTYGIRPGLLRANDLVLVNVLTRPGDAEFGFQILRAPLYVLLLYRASFLL